MRHPCGYHFGTFQTLATFVKYLNSPLVQRTKGARAFFEVFLSKSPLRVGFDLEYKFARPQHAVTAEGVLGEARDKETFLRALLVDRLLPWLSKLAGFEITTADCGCLDASNAEKLSFHVVVDTVFIPKSGLPQFAGAIQDEFKATLSPLLDVGVYNSRPFRLAGCSKVGGKRDLLPVSRVGDVQFGATPPFDGTFTVELLERQMWTCVPPDAVALTGLAAPPRPAPRVQKQSISLRGGVVTSEVLAALEPYLAAAGFTTHGDVLEQATQKPAYFFRFSSTQTCPFCGQRPHLRTHYRLVVWLEPDSPFGKDWVKPWSSNCAGDLQKHFVGPPISLHALAPGRAHLKPPPSGDDDEEEPESYGGVYPAEPPAWKAEPTPALRTYMTRLLGGFDADGEDVLQFRHLVVDGVWTLRTNHFCHRTLLPPGQEHDELHTDYRVYVEDGQARVVLAVWDVRLLVASFPAKFVPPALRSARLSGVPFHEPACFVPALVRFYNTAELDVEPLEFDPMQHILLADPSLLFQVRLRGGGAPRVCAVCAGQLHVRVASLWLLVDDTSEEALAPQREAFQRVYGEQLARLNAVPAPGGRCNVKDLNMVGVYPWQHAPALATELFAEDAVPCAPPAAEKTGLELRARMARRLQRRKQEEAAEVAEVERRVAAEEAEEARRRKDREADEEIRRNARAAKRKADMYRQLRLVGY